MKKLIVLVAAAAGLRWVFGKSKSAQSSAQRTAKPADPWAEASDRV